MTPQHVQSKKPEPLTNVAIIGCGNGGKALMEMFAGDALVRIVGIAEISPTAMGVPLAKKLGIPIRKNFRTILNSSDIDLVIDVSGNPTVEAALLNVNRPDMAIIGGPNAKYMWQLIDARIRAKQETEQQLNKYQHLARLYVKEAASAVSEERTRIACDIHDGLIQTLVGLNYKLDLCQALAEQDSAQCLEVLTEIKTQLRSSIEEARYVIFNLRPLLSSQLDMIPAVKNYLKSFEAQARIKTVFWSEGHERALGSKTKIFLFRIIQESLSNVRKHAKATQVKVSVDIQNHRVLTTIEDNGIGFDAEMAFQNAFTWDSFGLRAIIERARIIGGDATIESQHGNGTRITVESPISRPRSKTSTRSSLPMVSSVKRVSRIKKKHRG
ncbi:MAG: hypothetical protein CMH81_08475 [Nitrospiraceae bacterium]|nr:hypothetical protein [Nitrospiraceae bacterium]|tara:strand:+ start:2185 stop:3336 length:1152 start_codon:yes stop_codon:yes gene_type:complete